MIEATIYDAASGRILRFVRLKDAEEVDLNTAEGEGWIEGRGNPATERVINGKIVPRDAAELEADAIARAWDTLRSERHARLAATDWTQVADAPVDHTAWAAYRQALRDLPANTTDPRNPVWPVPPA